MTLPFESLTIQHVAETFCRLNRPTLYKLRARSTQTNSFDADSLVSSSRVNFSNSRAIISAVVSTVARMVALSASCGLCFLRRFFVVCDAPILILSIQYVSVDQMIGYFNLPFI